MRWIAAAVGLFGLVAYVRRRRQRPAEQEIEPADELRAKLAESRAEPEPPAPEAEPAGLPAASFTRTPRRVQMPHSRGSLRSTSWSSTHTANMLCGAISTSCASGRSKYVSA